MCTYPPSNNPTGISGLVNTIYDTPALELKDQKKEVLASELFSSLQHIFKSWDYRCLVPYSHKDPEKWRTYDMHGYRAASNQEMFDKVDTFKFEVLFNNWINPKVLAKYAKRPRKAWKRAYGFPYTTPVHWNKPDINSADPSPCWWRCAKLVKQISLKVFCLTFFNTCHNYKTTSAFPGDRGFCEAMCKRWRLLQVLRDPLYTEYFRTGSQPVDPGKAQILFISSQDFYHN